MIQVKNSRTKIEFTSYLACAYAEGFCEGEGATTNEQLEAWSFIALNGLQNGLQGFYGRTITHLKSEGILNNKGELNFDVINEMLEDQSLAEEI